MFYYTKSKYSLFKTILNVKNGKEEALKVMAISLIFFQDF